MNRFSQEIPPKTAWTVVAGLVVVFAIVFAGASSSDTNQGGVMGAAVRTATVVSKVFTVPIEAVGDVVKNVFVSDTADDSFADVDTRRDEENCIVGEIAAMRNAGVIAATIHESARGSSRLEDQAKTNAQDAILAEMAAAGISSPITRLGCVVTGIATRPLTPAEIDRFTKLGRLAQNFGATAANPTRPAGGAVSAPAGGSGQ